MSLIEGRKGENGAVVNQAPVGPESHADRGGVELLRKSPPLPPREGSYRKMAVFCDILCFFMLIDGDNPSVFISFFRG